MATAEPGTMPSGLLRPSSTGYGSPSRGHGVWVPAFAGTTRRTRRVFCPRSPVGERVVLQPADLHVVAVHIVHVQAAGAAVANVLDPERGELGPGAVAVEIGDRQRKVVDDRLRRRLRPRRRRRLRIGRADDEMRQRYVLGGDVVGLLAFLAERHGAVASVGAHWV